jgi:hypothetical protein
MLAAPPEADDQPHAVDDAAEEQDRAQDGPEHEPRRYRRQ